MWVTSTLAILGADRRIRWLEVAYKPLTTLLLFAGVGVRDGGRTAAAGAVRGGRLGAVLRLGFQPRAQPVSPADPARGVPGPGRLLAGSAGHRHRGVVALRAIVGMGPQRPRVNPRD